MEFIIFDNAIECNLTLKTLAVVTVHETWIPGILANVTVSLDRGGPTPFTYA